VTRDEANGRWAFVLVVVLAVMEQRCNRDWNIAKQAQRDSAPGTW
jgi:hypothetical protein